MFLLIGLSRKHSLIKRAKKNKSYKPNGVAEIILPPYKTHEHDLNFVIHESAAAIAVGVTCLTLLC